MRKFLTAFILSLVAATSASAQSGTYMGKASTGEDVYYQGSNYQCGDLPRNDECWSKPLVSYTIGSDNVLATVNCRRGVFEEVWVGDKLVNRNMVPQSRAIQLVLDNACQR